MAQTIEDIEKLAEREANTAQLLHDQGRTSEAVVSAWHSMILFATVDELRCRQEAARLGVPVRRVRKW